LNAGLKSPIEYRMSCTHDEFMQLALREAGKAGQMNEVPVGAVLVDAAGQVLAAACNRTISHNDPTAHAEILALRRAAARLGNYRLVGTTLYVTIEPCIMCMGAIVHARVQRVVFGTPDLKWGSAGSLYNFALDQRLNHRPEIIQGICQDQCRNLIQDFFRQKRQAL
jgi:tRNA(adenine34) deaminase